MATGPVLGDVTEGLLSTAVMHVVSDISFISTSSSANLTLFLCGIGPSSISATDVPIQRKAREDLIQEVLEIEKVSSRDGALGEADPSSARGVDVDIVFSQSMPRLVRADV
jgi:hypothetical protein